MFRKVFILVALLGVIAAGAVTYLYLKPTAAASRPIEAVPLAGGSREGVPVSGGEGQSSTPATPTTAPTAIVQPAAVETTTPAVPTSPAASAAWTGERIFEIDPAQSEVRFIIDEVLRGAPKTVIGVTNQVSGQIAIDLAQPHNTRVGVIQVNARTLATDNDMRNRAIKNRILLTDQYEFITFTPRSISALPAEFTPNQPFTFQIGGDLTIRGVTRPVTFDMQVTPLSENQLTGLGRTVVRYADFGIAIPSVPMVTGVEEEVELEIEFIATGA